MKLKIAILGTRGVPNNYGGFEQIAGYLARGLVQREHEVTVYNSSKHVYQLPEWHGVKIIHCFDPEYLIGTAGQFIYDFNCIINARKHDYDIILMLGYTSSSIWGFLYPKESIVITNMDGLEWKRAKYSAAVKKMLKHAERLAIKTSAFYIADSPVIKKYLDKEYHINSKYIAYGAHLDAVANEALLKQYDLQKYQYLMLMARMEPENNIEMILDGFCASSSKLPFIVVGNTSNKFGTYLEKKYKQEPRIRFLGGIFEENIVLSLTSYCSLYFHGHSVGGTNPSLLHAMAAGAAIAAHQNPFNQSILKDNSPYFSGEEDVCACINAGNYIHADAIENNKMAIENEFTWDKIINEYERYFMECYAARYNYYPYPIEHEKSIVY